MLQILFIFTRQKIVLSQAHSLLGAIWTWRHETSVEKLKHSHFKAFRVQADPDPPSLLAESKAGSSSFQFLPQYRSKLTGK